LGGSPTQFNQCKKTKISKTGRLLDVWCQNTGHIICKGEEWGKTMSLRATNVIFYNPELCIMTQLKLNFAYLRHKKMNAKQQYSCGHKLLFAIQKYSHNCIATTRRKGHFTGSDTEHLPNGR
jgi:hypothetical protein